MSDLVFNNIKARDTRTAVKTARIMCKLIQKTVYRATNFT